MDLLPSQGGFLLNLAAIINLMCNHSRRSLHVTAGPACPGAGAVRPQAPQPARTVPRPRLRIWRLRVARFQGACAGALSPHAGKAHQVPCTWLSRGLLTLTAGLRHVPPSLCSAQQLLVVWLRRRLFTGALWSGLPSLAQLNTSATSSRLWLLAAGGPPR